MSHPCTSTSKSSVLRLFKYIIRHIRDSRVQDCSHFLVEATTTKSNRNGDERKCIFNMMPGGGFFGAGGFGGSFGGSRRFEEQYHCYSVAYADKSHLEVSCWTVDTVMPSSKPIVSFSV